MKNIVASIALLPLAALAGDKIDQQVEVPKDGKILIENQRGDVTIKSWDKNAFKVTGTLDDKAQGYTLETQGSVTEFTVKMPKRTRGWNYGGGDGSTLTIYMPKTSELSFEGVNVNVSATDFSAGAQLKTVNGNVKATKLTGKIALETVNGDVDATDLAGNIRFETVNGEINDHNSSGKLRFNAVNGDIESNTSATDIRLENVNGEVEFKIKELEDLRLNTVNGEIDIRVEKMGGNASINMDTVSGDVQLFLPRDVSARFDIDAHSGGNIFNDLSEHKAKKAKYGPSRELEFILNGGQADVEIDTVSGRIEIKKN
ncbi:hypothetical protein BGP78_07010 [Pseudoalteromonas sp. MSK9-3]|uniref:DUF4097 family beta strand repeat-containing protein n=1 Tax=Pseudoalteromonas sp. MSK9-3 TaxID=1897633 RepID=UPI000E6CA448|nr:DUF4097 family beta strand repeat-containing protein [Pseudoalteromonas sp. MSK9-3]RJE77850.1 hypothetical protein BGP78_07010 [Pseudoalteromonas sp. MSK9-3]